MTAMKTFRERVEEILSDSKRLDNHTWPSKYGSMSVPDAILQAAKKTLVPEERGYRDYGDVKCYLDDRRAEGWNACCKEIMERIEK